MSSAADQIAARLATLRTTGAHPVLLGALVWASVATSSLLLIGATG